MKLSRGSLKTFAYLVSFLGMSASISCTPKINNLLSSNFKLNTNPVARFASSMSTFSGIQGGCTGSIILSRYDAAGSLTYPSSATTIALTGMVNGSFYLGASCSGTVVTSTSIPAGSATTTISFKNLVASVESIVMTSTGFTSSNLTVTTAGLLATRNDTTSGTSGEMWIASGDFNKDGIRDVVTTNSIDGKIYILKGNGDGTFQAAVGFGAMTAPRGPTVADINGDGWDDVVVAEFGTNAFTAFYNNQAGGFNIQAYATANAQGETVFLADFDSDGWMDAAVLTNTPIGNITVFWGNSTTPALNFSSNTVLALGAATAPLRVMAADFDKNGTLDFVVPEPATNKLLYVKNNGARSFNAVNTAINWGGGVTPADLDIGDINGDGNLDIVTSFRWATPQIAVTLGNGDGTFGATTTYSTSSTPNGIKLVDLNNDGYLDIVNATTSASPGLQIWFGVGDGTFVVPRNSFATVGNPMQITVSDFNSDGYKDLAVSSLGGTTQMSAWLNNF